MNDEQIRLTVEVTADEYALGTVRTQIEDLSSDCATVEIVGEEVIESEQ